MLYSTGDQVDPWLEYHDSDNPDKNSNPKKQILHNVKCIDKTVRNSSKEYCLEIDMKGGHKVLHFDSEDDLDSWSEAFDVVVRFVSADGSSTGGGGGEDEDEIKVNQLYQPSEEGTQIANFFESN